MKNNLDVDLSPCLQQYKNNPVHWQIWSSEILKKAKKLSNSLNGYLNVYKSLMLSSLKSINYFSFVEYGKKRNQDRRTI